MEGTDQNVIRRHNPEGLRQAGIGSCHISEHQETGLIFVAGQIGLDASGKVVGPSVGEQLQQIYANFDIILADLGLDRSAFLSRNVYVTDLVAADAPEVLDAVREYFAGVPCPSTLLEVKGLAHPDLVIEMDAILVR